MNAAQQQIVGRGRRERVSHHYWCGNRFVKSRRRVNSAVRRLLSPMNMPPTRAVLLLLVAAGVACGQARPATCDVRPLWVQLNAGVDSRRLGSATLPSIGRFRTDGREGQTIRSFTDTATGLVVTVGIDYVFEYSTTPQRPYQINLAITVADRENKDLFESVSSAEASTRYSKKWNLTVTKNVNFQDLVYMYTLRCWDNPMK